MRIIGGIYRETCLNPGWDQIFGSAGRAACAIAAIFKAKPTLSGSYSVRDAASVEATFCPYGINLDLQWESFHYAFAYSHPLARPASYIEGRLTKAKPRSFKDGAILVFGTMEQAPSVAAGRLIIDPQGENASYLLSRHGKKADQIALVANESEIRGASNAALSKIVHSFFSKEPRLFTIVIKRGSLGAEVYEKRRAKPAHVPPYDCGGTIFKIGSGDVFSAVFAYAWAVKNDDPRQAADLASRAVAAYVADPYFNFDRTALRKATPLNGRRNIGKIYIAAPFFTLSDFLILAEARTGLASLGARAFSPFHEIGSGRPDEIARKDMRAIEQSHCLLALLHNHDPGTIFEIGYARARRIPVLIHSEQLDDVDSTMFVGSRCMVERDFCTALYRAHWLALGASQ